MKIITKAEAKEQGLKTYFTGEPCRNGHIAKRFCCNGQCDECGKASREKNKKEVFKRYYDKTRQRPEIVEAMRTRSKEYMRTHKEERQEYNRKYGQENKEEIRRRNKEWRENNPNHIREYYLANKDKRFGYSLKFRLENPIRHLLIQAKSRASKANIPFDITYEDVEVAEVCPVLGVPLIYGGGKPYNDDMASLDRVIPDKGYVKGNVRVISRLANRKKQDLTLDEIELIKAYILMNSEEGPKLSLVNTPVTEQGDVNGECSL